MREVDREMLTAAYERLGNVHKAAAELGISHAVAHRRLTAWGVMRPINCVTAAETAAIVAYYRDTPPAEFNAAAFCVAIGRPEITVSRVARAHGLTNPARPKVAEHRAGISRRAKERWKVQEHPKGFKGNTHGASARATISVKSRAAWEHHKATETGLMAPHRRQEASDRATARMALRTGEGAYSRAKHGRREDIGPMYFRSTWEANYARYLNWLQGRGEIDRWEYEPETFWFEKIKRGVRSYKPDFRIHEKGASYFVEVKGWMDPKSITKLRRMKKYHPTVEVRLVDQKQYSAIAAAVSRMIPNWESPAKPGAIHISVEAA